MGRTGEHQPLSELLTFSSCCVDPGAACVVFSSHASYIAAVSARFMQLNYGSLDKKVHHCMSDCLHVQIMYCCVFE